MAGIKQTSSQLALVTGASGFIGRELCQHLRAQGIWVRAVLRQMSEGPWDEVVCLDLTDEKFPEGALKGVDTIFHLAGKAHALSETSQDDEEYFRINTEATSTLLEAAKDAGVRRFVFISSVKAMNEGGKVCQDEDTVCRPETPYGKSKLAAEHLVLTGGYVPEPVVLRLSMVYGCTHKGNLPRMIHAVANGRFPPLPNVGNQRTMVHVEDVVRAALLAAEIPDAVGQTYIVTDGQTYSTRQLYEWICAALDKPVPVWTFPQSLLRVMAKLGDFIGVIRGRRFVLDSDALDKLMGSSCYSSFKLQRELGFRPKKELQSSLREMVDWLGLKSAYHSVKLSRK